MIRSRSVMRKSFWLFCSLALVVGANDVSAADPPFVSGPFHPYLDRVEKLPDYVAYPPEIAGKWSGEDWGRVELARVGDGLYEGTYSGTMGNDVGRIRLKWSETVGRYEGTWREGSLRHGLLSVRIMPNHRSIRGAFATDLSCEPQSGWPRLADLEWSRLAEQGEESDEAEKGHIFPDERNE